MNDKSIVIVDNMEVISMTENETIIFEDAGKRSERKIHYDAYGMYFTYKGVRHYSMDCVRIHEAAGYMYNRAIENLKKGMMI